MTELFVAVRDLVAFCHRSGDLDHRFTPSPTGEQGVEGHQRVYRRRPSEYCSEYAVAYSHQEGDLVLQLRGRADGYDPEEGVVEEIKTCRTAPQAIPEAVSRAHLAQARTYAAIIAMDKALEQVDVRLTWFNIDSGQEQTLSQVYSRDELEQFLLTSLQRFSSWLRQLAEKRRVRDRSLVDLSFPHAGFRAGQREIAELAYKCIDQGGQLLVEAPTGLGKTAAVLYPALKALATGKHERIAFVTARTVGRRAAEQTLMEFAEAGMVAPALSLSARESICFSPGKACHGDDCPYALGYYDRLPAALEAAIAAPSLSRADIEALARRFGICPYQLSMDLLPWVDLVIADLHYVYSLTATLGGLMQQSDERWTVLLDEAHNLPGRARGMFRAELPKALLMAARRDAPRGLKSALDGVNRRLLALQREDWVSPEFDSRPELPPELLDSLQRFSGRVGERLAAEPALLARHTALMDFYFAVLQFLRVAEYWGEEYRFEMSRTGRQQGLRLTLNCLDPARLLRQKQAPLHALVAFSATLSPSAWTRNALGLSPEAVFRRQVSPFATEQLQVFLATGIDTRYAQRETSLPDLASLLLDWLARERGNCILYFPSYRYLQACLAAMEARGLAELGRCCWMQERDQGEAGRHALLEMLERRRDVAAFCILGGVFGEGIDLPGDRLTSVAIVGVGMPQFNRDNEQLREYFQQQYGAGFEYAYLYPGMQKVDQALGRVVRSSLDRGRALLVDSRYARPDYRALLPPWWDYQLVPAKALL